MRLIDVDKIIITRQEYVGALTLKERLRRLLKVQPTVEAIPIDWLRMWFTKKASLIGITLMGEIETDWEKENEQNKESTSQAD